jgi:hypothetical protein
VGHQTVSLNFSAPYPGINVNSAMDNVVPDFGQLLAAVRKRNKFFLIAGSRAIRPLMWNIASSLKENVSSALHHLKLIRRKLIRTSSRLMQ